MIARLNMVWLLERFVYGGVDLVARLMPVTEDDVRRESLLDRMLDDR